jgi:hypothetical protein
MSHDLDFNVPQVIQGAINLRQGCSSQQPQQPPGRAPPRRVALKIPTELLLALPNRPQRNWLLDYPDPLR